ncbi:MAG TPA: VOC family protein [Pseudolabrys sp.]|jgi:catechol 2,3-dioxygenase-like lactoylglutathione lyase family enzyme|nr:VOC family protein [Pseudolabrys sp.]
MARGLDHIVHAVRDLDRAAELYRRLGFTVGARNRHPWGTHNHIVQFPGCFIELLAFVEPEKLGGDAFSSLFAAYNRDFAGAHEGLSMLILESRDSGHDVSDFRVAGIAASESLRFEREAKRPDGTAVKVGFSLAFAEDRKAPQIHFATCQQHFPENFWNPAFQTHANSVAGIAAVVVVTDDPAAHRAMLHAFSGAEAVREEGDGYAMTLPRGAIEVMTGAEFVRRYGVPAPQTDGGARLAALRFATANPAAARALIGAAGIPARHAGGALVVQPAAGLGATLLFGPAG